MTSITAASRVLGGPDPEARPNSLREFWRKYRRNRLAVLGIAALLIMVTLAVFAPELAKDPSDSRSATLVTLSTGEQVKVPSRTPPCSHVCNVKVFRGGKFVTISYKGTHWFGTDANGRDMFSRVIHGSRTSLIVGFSVAIISTLIGLVVGGLAGYYGGWIDNVLMRFTDVVLSLPYLLLAIILAGVLNARGTVSPQNSRNVVIAVLTLLGWMEIARVFRGQILTVKENEYVTAARAVGCSDKRILLRHIFPNAIQPVIVVATIGVGSVILSESVLSFLGLGIREPQAAWGLMLAPAGGELANAPFLVLFPSLAVFITVISFIFIGDGLRDALDPRIR